LTSSVLSLVYGVDTGIVATTIAHDSFKLYMYGTLDAQPSLTGAIVSTYYAGNCLGSFGSGALMDRWGRKSLVFIATLCAIVGTAIQTGSVNVGMMIAGRIVAGLATGALLTIVPLYIAELAPPDNRAYLVALKGLLTAIGYLVANWIGFAGSYAKGDVQWRVPLAMQIPPAVLLLVLTIFLPNSPRWRKCLPSSWLFSQVFVYQPPLTQNTVVSKERHEEAETILNKLHAKRGDEFIQREMSEIREQLALEAAQRKQSSWAELFTLRLARRLLLACFILNMTKLSGGKAHSTFPPTTFLSPLHFLQSIFPSK
jgi:MFS family permease